MRSWKPTATVISNYISPSVWSLVGNFKKHVAVPLMKVINFQSVLENSVSIFLLFNVSFFTYAFI